MARQAMNCRFELLLAGGDQARLQAAGQEALDEIEALDRQLNFYSPASEISHINGAAAQGWVPVEAELFRLFERCRDYWVRSNGAFDPTVSPLLDLWGFHFEQQRIPSERDIEDTRLRIGMQHVELDPRRRIRFLRRGISMNLGSVGKGYALDRAGDILRDCAVSSALLHAGTSSVLALGKPPGSDSWTIEISDPRDSERALTRLGLCNSALGVSGNTFNTVEIEGRRYGHVFDPGSGYPVKDGLLAAVVASGAAEADALATALLCRGPEDPQWLKGTEQALWLGQSGPAIRIRAV